jgi:hypothetical protein
VKTIAGVALFGMILYRGIPILNLINKFVTGIQTPPTKKK